MPISSIMKETTKLFNVFVLKLPFQFYFTFVFPVERAMSNKILLSTKMHRAALTSRIALQSWTSRHCAIVNCLSGIPSTRRTVFKLITGIYYAFRQSVHLLSLLCFHFWYSSSCFQEIDDTLSNQLYVLLAKKSLVFSLYYFLEINRCDYSSLEWGKEKQSSL
jgi:hypothetical protein